MVTNVSEFTVDPQPDGSAIGRVILDTGQVFLFTLQPPVAGPEF